jgi:bifunctional UDP-N-acetylglucosamine pyrophosphorylase/glucosamine-1-phosphate N-acetyltransferase
LLKVLQPLRRPALLSHVLDTARQLGADATTSFYGHGGERVRDGFSDPAVQWVQQAEQHGPDTRSRRRCCRSTTRTTCSSSRRRAAGAAGHAATAGSTPAASARGVLSVVLDDPTGYGRIVRDGAGTVARIVEHKDANAKERALRE